MRSTPAALVSVLVLVGGCELVALSGLETSESWDANATVGTGGSGQGGAASSSSSSASSVASSGSGGEPYCTEAQDCQDKQGNPTACYEWDCDGGNCKQVFGPPQEVCGETGELFCNGLGDCVECLENADCADGLCEEGLCLAAGCTDTVLNGTETDIDCGGDCSPCDHGDDCAASTDCTSILCVSQVCQQCAVGACPGNRYCDLGSFNCVDQKGCGQDCSEDRECLFGNCLDFGIFGKACNCL